MITIKIETINAAFGDTPEESRSELARILWKLADSIAEGERKTTLRDYNGNKVGSVEYE